MADFTKEFSGVYSSSAYNSLGIKIKLSISVDEGTGSGTCNWVATTFIPSGKNPVSFASRQYNSYDNNYITINGVKRWDFYNIYINQSGYRRAVYTTESDYTSNQLDYYSGNYSSSMNNQYLWTLKTNFASGSFTFNVDSNGNYTIPVYGQFRMVYDNQGITINDSYSLHVDLYKSLYKWTPSNGWQLVAKAHKNDNWSRGLNVYKWTSGTGWRKL